MVDLINALVRAFYGVYMTPERARTIVGRIGWLSRQPTAFREAVLANTELRRIAAGEIYTSLAEPPGGITCVVEGFMDVYVAPASVPMRLVYIARAGWWFGDIAVISKAGRPASVVARTDGWLLHLPEFKLARLANMHNDFWRRFSELSVAHFDNALLLASALSIPNLQHRLAALICWLSGPGFFPAAADELPVTREEIGEIAGLSRNTAGRVLADLDRDGLIQTRYGRLVIADRSGLEALLSR